MKGLGNHVIGDQIYGKNKIENVYPNEVIELKRQALHSERILITKHPITNEPLDITADLAPDLKPLDNLFLELN